ncbi:MAG: hypothetical protein ACHP9Z_12270 [Streptosporangiales bacterium]
MNTLASSKLVLSAADDAERMLWSAILRDAAEWHYDKLEACGDCVTAGGACLAHWDQHEEPTERYRELRNRLGSYDGLSYGVRYPFTGQEQDIITEAVKDAIAYRTRGETIESVALIAAYREFAILLGIADALQVSR